MVQSTSRATTPTRPKRRPAVMRDVSALMGSRVAVALMGWIGTLLIVRHLSQMGWGEYSFVFSLLSLLAIATGAVSTRPAVRGLLDSPDPSSFAGSYVILRGVLGIVGYSAALIFVATAGYPATVIRATALGGLVVIISAVTNGYELLFSVHQKMYRLAAGYTIGQAAQLVLTIALAVAGTTVTGFMVPAVLCEIVVLLVVLRGVTPLMSIRYRVLLSTWGQLAKAALPFAIGQALFLLYANIDTIMLSKMQTFTAVGFYAAAGKFGNILGSLPMAVSLAITSRLVRTWPSNASSFWANYQKAFVALFAAATLLLSEFTLFAHPLITTLFGGQYGSAATAGVLVVAGACVYFFTNLTITALMAQGRDVLYPIAGVIGLAINVGLNLWFIPHWSYTGAAVSTLITELAVAAILIPGLLRGHKVFPGLVRPIGGALVAGLASTAVAMVANQVIAWEAAAVISVGVFLLALHALRVTGPSGLRSSLFDEDNDQTTDPQPPPLRTGRLRTRAQQLTTGTAEFVAAAVQGRAAATATAVVGAAAVSGATLAGYGLETLGAAIIVPALAMILRRPQRGILLLAALVPFDGMLVLVTHSGTMRSWKEALVLLIIVATFVCPKAARADRVRRAPRWLGPLALLLMYSVATFGLAPTHVSVTGFRIEYFYILLPIALWRCPLSARERDRLITLLMIIGALTAAYGLLQQVLGAGRLNALGYPYNTVIRFSGSHLRSFSSFSQPFPFAYFLMLVILLGLSVAMAQPHRRRSFLFFCSLPLLFAAIALTFVRGALLGIAAGAIYLVVRRYRKVLWAVPILLVMLLYLPASFSASTFASKSLGERGTGWLANVSTVVQHPLGHGLGTSGAAAQKLATGTPTAPAATPSHPYQPDNYYYNVLYELGVPGLWFFVLVLVGMIVEGDRNATPGAPRGSPFALGVTAFFVAAAGASFVSTFFEIFPMDVFFWMLVGVLSSSSMTEQAAYPQREQLAVPS